MKAGDSRVLGPKSSETSISLSSFRVCMVNTTTPLSLEERHLLLERAVHGPWNYESFPTRDPRKLVLFLYSTGMHPEVLSDTGKYEVSIEKEIQGLVVKWRRPKQKKYVNAPLYWQAAFDRKDPNFDPAMREFWPDIQAWVQDWFTYWVHCRREVVFRDVRRWGHQNGIPRLAPRVLRHDYIARVYETVHDVNHTRNMAGCSLSIAMDYADSNSVLSLFRGR